MERYKVSGGRGTKTADSAVLHFQQALLRNATKAPPGSKCDRIQLNYQIAPAVICGMCFIFGIVYTFFGYRFFKAVMFMTGFIFGGIVTYLICLEENLLPLGGKIGVALAAGILCGLITMLVQYVGLFMTGFHTGLFIAIAALIIVEQFYHPTTKWIPIGLMFGTGLLCAVMNLYFQKGLTIIGTSFFGAALMAVALDYFVELFMMVLYVWERVKAENSDSVCWFSWVLLGLWPATFLVGTIAQWKVTGKGFDHQEVVVRKRRQNKADIKRVTERDRRDGQHSRYRHLYQVRRSNGDVISQGSPGSLIISKLHSGHTDHTVARLAQSDASDSGVLTWSAAGAAAGPHSARASVGTAGSHSLTNYPMVGSMGSDHPLIRPHPLGQHPSN